MARERGAASDASLWYFARYDIPNQVLKSVFPLISSAHFQTKVCSDLAHFQTKVCRGITRKHRLEHLDRNIVFGEV